MKTIKLNAEYSIEELKRLIAEAESNSRDYELPPEWSDLKTVYWYYAQSDSKEESALFIEKQSLLREMTRFASCRNGGWKPNWNDGYEKKYGLLVSYGKSETDVGKVYNTFVFGIAVKSEAIANKMLEIFGERIEEIYNNQ